MISEIIRDVLMEKVAWGRMYAIALSGGIDSCSILAASIECGNRPAIVTYTPDTHESTDFLMAQKTAKNLALPFHGVRFPMEASALEAAVREVIAAGYSGKMEVESLPPIVAVGKEAATHAEVLLTGDQSDGYFQNNNWMSRNYDRKNGIPGYLRTHVKNDKSPDRIDALRNKYYEEDLSNTQALSDIIGGLIECSFPFRDERIRKGFVGLTWSDVNLPRNKEPLRAMFDYEGMGIHVRPQPVNLHRGDSLFANMLSSTLLKQPHLQGSWRSAQGLYSAMKRGEV